MARLLSLGLTVLSLTLANPVFAGSHCSCDKKCTQDCQKGKSEHCHCKHCECAKGEGCKHEKCNQPKESK